MLEQKQEQKLERTNVDLDNLDLHKVELLIKPVLEQYSEICGAYFFGSTLDRCRVDSDVDVGLVLSSKAHLTEKEQDYLIARILNEVPRFGKHPIDLCVLKISDVFFAHRVFRTGKLFYVKDSEELTDFIEIISHKYRENYPPYRRALEVIASEV